MQELYPKLIPHSNRGCESARGVRSETWLLEDIYAIPRPKSAHKVFHFDSCLFITRSFLRFQRSDHNLLRALRRAAFSFGVELANHVIATAAVLLCSPWWYLSEWSCSMCREQRAAGRWPHAWALWALLKLRLACDIPSANQISYRFSEWVENFVHRKLRFIRLVTHKTVESVEAPITQLSSEARLANDVAGGRCLS